MANDIGPILVNDRGAKFAVTLKKISTDPYRYELAFPDGTFGDVRFSKGEWKCYSTNGSNIISQLIEHLPKVE